LTSSPFSEASSIGPVCVLLSSPVRNYYIFLSTPTGCSSFPPSYTVVCTDYSFFSPFSFFLVPLLGPHLRIYFPDHLTSPHPQPSFTLLTPPPKILSILFSFPLLSPPKPPQVILPAGLVAMLFRFPPHFVGLAAPSPVPFFFFWLSPPFFFFFSPLPHGVVLSLSMPFL